MINKLYDILKEIDTSIMVQDFKKNKELVYHDKLLLEDIKTYHLNKNNDLKQKIVKNINYINYKKSEREIYLFVLAINKIFKDLKPLGGICENHKR